MTRSEATFTLLRRFGPWACADPCRLGAQATWPEGNRASSVGAQERDFLFGEPTLRTDHDEVAAADELFPGDTLTLARSVVSPYERAVA